MKSRTQLLFLALLPALLSATLNVSAQETAEAIAPAQSTLSTSTFASQSTLAADDDSSSGLADERLRVAETAPILSITDAIALALQNNPQRAAAWAAVEAAEARIGIAKSGGKPQVNLSGEAGVQRAFSFPKGATSGSLPGGSSGGSQVGPGRGWVDNQSLSATANIPIYTGGRVSANKRIARHSAQSQYAQARSVEQELVYATAISYLDVLRGQQILTVGDSNLEVARERRRIAGVRFDAGAAARLEVLRAETDLANARQVRISSSNNLGQSLSTLNTLMGRAPETPLRVEPIISLTLPGPLFNAQAPTSEGIPVGDERVTVDSAPGIKESTSDVTGIGIGVVRPAASNVLQETSRQGRQSLAATQEQIEAAEASVDLARAARKPSIDLNILGLIRNPVSFAGRFLASIGANIAQNLFNGGRTSSQVREAKAIVKQLRSQLTEQEQAIANDIEQSLLLLDSAQKRLSSADVGVVAAREALRAAQLGYSAGAQTAVEVSDAQAALLTAETDAVNARFDVAASQARLSAAVGVYPVEAVDAYNSVVEQEKELGKK